MADERARARPHGDEAELFRAVNDELLRKISGTVNAPPELIEDACAFAWTQFLEHQPDRERSWRGWLFRVAQREAWALARDRRTAVHITDPDERAGGVP